MIYYFSGTGNSEYAAKRIGQLITDEVGNLFEKIKSRDFSKIHSERTWVIVVPTYAWRIPRLVEEWLERTPFAGSREIYFVMTCGGSIGNAGSYLKKLCAQKNLIYRGCAQIVMPENYIALFTTPERQEALKIIGKAQSAIDRAALLIQSGESFPEPSCSVGDKLNSGLVNRLFYPVFVHAKKFYATDACISCGKCVRVCPLENIRLKNARPVWGDNCTHCMACISRCPEEAIEYGTHSRGLPRYVCMK